MPPRIPEESLAAIEQAVAKHPADCRGRMKWPSRSVYFFHETGENRSNTGEGPPVVRVGTHALKAGGSTTLWAALRTH